jgi:hypothetical protein
MYTTSLPYEQTSKSPSIVPQFEDEAFELAFAEAENAVHVAEIEPEIEEQPKLSEKEEADRLAKTAGELFDRLQHEQEMNEKFRNSSFMALMKKLRDREVVVEGNKMVDSMNLHAEETNTIERIVKEFVESAGVNGVETKPVGEDVKVIWSSRWEEPHGGIGSAIGQ